MCYDFYEKKVVSQKAFNISRSQTCATPTSYVYAHMFAGFVYQRSKFKISAQTIYISITNGSNVWICKYSMMGKRDCFESFCLWVIWYPFKKQKEVLKGLPRYELCLLHNEII